MSKDSDDWGDFYSGIFAGCLICAILLLCMGSTFRIEVRTTTKLPTVDTHKIEEAK